MALTPTFPSMLFQVEDEPNFLDSGTIHMKSDISAEMPLSQPSDFSCKDNHINSSPVSTSLGPPWMNHHHYDEAGSRGLIDDMERINLEETSFSAGQEDTRYSVPSFSRSFDPHSEYITSASLYSSVAETSTQQQPLVSAASSSRSYDRPSYPPPENDSKSHTPTTLGWTENLNDVTSYVLRVQSWKDPFLELRQEYMATEVKPNIVYLDCTK